MISSKNRTPQWIELYNTTDKDITIRHWKIVGWSIRSNREGETVQRLPQRTLRWIVIKAKSTHLISAFDALETDGSSSDNLENMVYILSSGSTYRPWVGIAFMLELRDREGNPIDRIGNIKDNKIRYWFPEQTYNWSDERHRTSLIRRLKSQTSRRYNFSLGVTEYGWFAADEVEELTRHRRSEHYYGSPSDVATPGFRTEGADPLPVTLSSFVPQITDDGVVLSWTTESEIENAGFNILRSETKDGSFVKINTSLIQGAGTTSDRNEYTWTDTTAKPNIEYYYRIEDMSFDGISEVLTTERLKGVFTAKNRSLTLWSLFKK